MALPARRRSVLRAPTRVRAVSETGSGIRAFLFRVDATYEGEEPGSVFIDNTVSIDYCGVIPDDISEAPEIYAGGTSSGNHGVAVPGDSTDGALLTVEDHYAENSERFFVEAD